MPAPLGQDERSNPCICLLSTVPYCAFFPDASPWKKPGAASSV